jgi:hypothetical protein
MVTKMTTATDGHLGRNDSEQLGTIEVILFRSNSERDTLTVRTQYGVLDDPRHVKSFRIGAIWEIRSNAK